MKHEAERVKAEAVAAKKAAAQVFFYARSDMCLDMCLDMWLDMWLDMCSGMCSGMCLHMCMHTHAGSL